MDILQIISDFVVNSGIAQLFTSLDGLKQLIMIGIS